VNIHCDGCKHKVKKLLQKIEGTAHVPLSLSVSHANTALSRLFLPLLRLLQMNAVLLLLADDLFLALFLTSTSHFTGRIFFPAIKTQSFGHLHLKAPLCLAEFINTTLLFFYDVLDVQTKFGLLALVEFERKSGKY
jgi:copper chaperone CopZ